MAWGYLKWNKPPKLIKQHVFGFRLFLGARCDLCVRGYMIYHKSTDHLSCSSLKRNTGTKEAITISIYRFKFKQLNCSSNYYLVCSLSVSHKCHIVNNVLGLLWPLNVKLTQWMDIRKMHPLSCIVTKDFTSQKYFRVNKRKFFIPPKELNHTETNSDYRK